MGPSHGKERPEMAGDPAEERKRMKMFYLGAMMGLIIGAAVTYLWLSDKKSKERLPDEPMMPFEDGYIFKEEKYEVINLMAETWCDAVKFEQSEWIREKNMYELKHGLIKQLEPFIVIEKSEHELLRKYQFRARLYVVDRGNAK